MFAGNFAGNIGRVAPLMILVVSAASLGLAYIAQYVFGLEPCILCLYQRVPYYVAIALGVIALMLPISGPGRAIVIGLCGAAFLINAGIASYHVGVEQHWWVSATGCGGALPDTMTIEQMKTEMLHKPAKSCDDVDWTFLGLSIATYNVPYSLFLGAASLWAGLRMRRTQ